MVKTLQASLTRWRPVAAPRPPRASSRRAAASLFCLLLLAAPRTTARAGSVTVLEENGRPFCTGRPGFRAIRAALPDGAGGQLLVTEDTPPNFPPSEKEDIFVIHLDADLTPLPVGDGLFSSDPCGALIAGGPRWQLPSSVQARGNGAFLVAITDDRDGPDRAFVALQEFDQQGRPLLAPEPVVLSNREFESRHARLTPDGMGGHFIAWAELYPPQPTFTGSLLLQRLDAGGRPLWAAPTQVSFGIGLNPFNTVVAADGGGGAYVAWDEDRPDLVPLDGSIWVQHVDGDGRPLWPAGGLRPWDGRDEYNGLDLLAVDDGAVLVFSSVQIRAQKYSPGGARLWGAQARVISDRLDFVAYQADRPRLRPAPGGDFFAVWQEYHEHGDSVLAARRLGRDGTLPWPVPVEVRRYSDRFFGVAASVLRDGSLAVAWEESRPIGDWSNLFMQNIDARGRVKGPLNGLPVALAPGGQSLPIFLQPADGAPASEATVAWSDQRLPSLTGDSYGLFVQKIRFFSSPRLDAAPATALRQGEEAVLTLHGDDLQPGASMQAGGGVTAELIDVTPDAPDRPGDRLLLKVRADPEARAGARDLTLVNPDGGAVTLAAVLSIGLRPGRADVDRSGRVDGYDLALLADAFGRREGEPRFAPASDINSDGVVDGLDLAPLAARFGGPPETAP